MLRLHVYHLVHMCVLRAQLQSVSRQILPLFGRIR